MASGCCPSFAWPRRLRTGRTRSKYAQRVSRQEQTGLADEFEPILPGQGERTTRAIRTEPVDYINSAATHCLLELRSAPASASVQSEKDETPFNVATWVVVLSVVGVNCVKLPLYLTIL